MEIFALSLFVFFHGEVKKVSHQVSRVIGKQREWAHQVPQEKRAVPERTPMQPARETQLIEGSRAGRGSRARQWRTKATRVGQPPAGVTPVAPELEGAGDPRPRKQGPRKRLFCRPTPQDDSVTREMTGHLTGA